MGNNQDLHEDKSVLPAGVRTIASLGHLDSVREVWVIPTKVQGKLDKVMDMLAGQQKWEKEDHAEVGTLCVTVFREDQVMYRAMVITVLGAGKVVVRFVDFESDSEDYLSIEDHRTLHSRSQDWLDDGGQPREQGDGGGGVRKRRVQDRSRQEGISHRGDNVLAFVATAVTDDNCMEITADDSDDEAVALSYLESVGVVFVTPVAVHEKLDTLMGQLADMADKLVPLKHMVVGSMVVARYMEMYRTRVMQVVDNMVTVVFIDYGNYQLSDSSSRYKLPTEL